MEAEKKSPGPQVWMPCSIDWKVKERPPTREITWQLKRQSADDYVVIGYCTVKKKIQKRKKG